MKICHLLDNVRPGVGVTQVIHDLMTDGRLECRGVCMDTREIDARFRRMVDQGVIVEAGSRAAAISALFRMKSDGYNILHVHSRKAVAVCIVARLIGYSVVRTQHFGTAIGPAPHGVRSKLRAARNLLTLRSWWINRWVAISETSRAYLRVRWNIPEERISLIRNGIDLSCYTPLSKSRVLALRRRFGWDDDWIVLISVGALVARKRHETMIVEFAEVAKACPDVMLVIVGEGSQRRRLEAAAAELRLDGRVMLLGLSDEVAALLGASDIYLHAALDEAFGLAVAEGMAAGLPAIVFDGKGPAEIVEDGVSGIVVRPDEPFGMARAVRRLIDDAALRKTMGDEARDQAMRRFSLGAMRDAYHAFYKRCASIP